MIVELRRNNQVIVPKRIAYDLGLDVGDELDMVAEDGVIKLTPVTSSASARPTQGRESGRVNRP